MNLGGVTTGDDAHHTIAQVVIITSRYKYKYFPYKIRTTALRYFVRARNIATQITRITSV